MHFSPIKAADEIEVRDAPTYLRWLAQRRGIALPATAHFTDKGIFAGSAVGAECLIEMPGSSEEYQRSIRTIEVEELDEAGEVIHSSRIGLKPNGALPWDQKKVRGIAGKVAKPTKSKATVSVTPHQGNDTPSTVGIEGQGLAEQVAALAEQVAALQAQLAALARQPEGKGDEAAPDATGRIEQALRRADDRPRRERIARAYLTMRAQRDEARKLYDTERMIAAERMATIWRVQDARKATIRMARRMRERQDLDRRALMAGNAYCAQLEQRAVRAEVALQAVEARLRGAATPHRVNWPSGAREARA